MENSSEKKEITTILETKRGDQIKTIQEKLAEAKEYVFQLCPDQIVASIKNNGDEFIWSKKIETKQSKKKKNTKIKLFKRKNIKKGSNIPNNIILLILESPHTDEFPGNKINGPAFGQTGKNINDKFIEMLNNSSIKDILPQKEICKIIIVNAIQYACSCGINLDILKESMLKNVWKHDEVKEDFRKRILIIKNTIIKYKKKLVAINCCTKPIKESVGNEIKKVFKENIYEVPHPAYWSRTKELPKIRKTQIIIDI